MPEGRVLEGAPRCEPGCPTCVPLALQVTAEDVPGGPSTAKPRRRPRSVATRDEREAQLLAAVANGPLTAREIAEQLGLRHSRVCDLMASLHRRGRVTRERGGRSVRWGPQA